MFGHRSDGKLVRTHDGIYTLMLHVMPWRCDSMNMTEFNVDLDILDKFIKQEYEKSGNIYTYLEILAAATVRTIFLRPDLNRFVVNRRIYQRNEIVMSMAIQKTLKGEQSNETALKFKYEGNENLADVHDKLSKGFAEAKSTFNDTDELTTKLASVPYFVMKIAVGLLKLLDNWGLLPKAVMDAEPFHTSFFITDMRSVKTPSIYHHVYNFGTTGLFLSTGVEKIEPYQDIDGSVKFRRVMPVKFVSDERFCDGYYFALSLKMLQRLLHNPNALMSELEPKPKELTKKERRAKAKQEKKDAKAAAKKEK